MSSWTNDLDECPPLRGRDILITKGSSLGFVGTPNQSLNADQHNAPAIVAKLFERFPDRCAFIGRWRGRPPENFVGVSVPISKIKQDHIEAFDRTPQTEIAESIARCMPDATTWVDITGNCPTTSVIDNPGGTKVQRTGAQRVAPYLLAARLMGTRRICIVTDVRCYPVNFEMGWWPELIPSCVLGQEQSTRTRKINREEWTYSCEYAGVENWFADGVPVKPWNARKELCYLGHAHLKDVRWKKGRLDTILAMDEACPGMTYHGYEWEEAGIEAAEPLPVENLYEALGSRYGYGAMLSPAPGFLTTKLRKYLIAGVFPLVWSNGLLYYDPDHRVVSENSISRIDPNWTIDDVRRYSESEVTYFYDEMVERTSPDWSKLWRALDGEDFGGYTRGRA